MSTDTSKPDPTSPSPSQHRPFWTIHQVAQERWNCCILTVHRLIKAGKLKPHRIGRMVRISQTELERFEREAQA
jgi:excisionase family DNA binding protein